MKKGILKRNWDIFIALILIIISVGLILWVITSCSGWGCLAFLGILIPMLFLFLVFTIVSIFRSIRNKKLSMLRWIWIVIFALVILVLISMGGVELFNPFLLLNAGQ